jgi:hypothetical protein
VRDQDHVSLTEWKDMLKAVSENYEDFIQKLSSLDTETRMAFGLPVALPPFDSNTTSVLTTPTPLRLRPQILWPQNLLLLLGLSLP